MKEKFDMQKAREDLEQTKTFIVQSAPNQTGYGQDHSRYPNLIAMRRICDVHMPVALDRIEELEAVNEVLIDRLAMANESMEVWHWLDTDDKSKARDKIREQLETEGLL